MTVILERVAVWDITVIPDMLLDMVWIVPSTAAVSLVSVNVGKYVYLLTEITSISQAGASVNNSAQQ